MSPGHGVAHHWNECERAGAASGQGRTDSQDSLSAEKYVAGGRGMQEMNPKGRSQPKILES